MLAGAIGGMVARVDSTRASAITRGGAEAEARVDNNKARATRVGVAIVARSLVAASLQRWRLTQSGYSAWKGLQLASRPNLRYLSPVQTQTLELSISRSLFPRKVL